MKNNNPLNIRKSSTQFIGEIIRENNKPFKDFVCPELGYRAAFRVLNTYITKYKVDTVEKIISRWQPPEDNNDTDVYISFVCEKTSFKPDKKFLKSDNDLILLVWQMSWVENGVKANMREVEKGYEIIELQNLDEIMKIIHDDDYPPAA